MGVTTGIEWTDATWNPIRGCSMVSAGCTHCYAQAVAHRFSGPGQPYEGLVQLDAAGKSTGKWNGAIRFVEEHLLNPLKWKPVLTGIGHGEGVLKTKTSRTGTVTVTRERPRRIFVNSMSDLFHENVTDAQIAQILAVCQLSDHTYQILTKRPARAQQLFSSDEFHGMVVDYADRLCLELDYEYVPHWPLPNVWLGVSVEDQKTADARIPLLLQTPAAVRFVSAEPLLGLVEMSGWLSPSFTVNTRECEPMDGRTAELLQKMGAAAYKQAGGSLIDWVIAGGESGPGARPMHPDWARSLRDQCKAAGVPFFFKQWGEWSRADYKTPSGTPGRYALMPQDGKTTTMYGASFTKLDNYPRHFTSFGSIVRERVGKKAAGHLLDGVAHREFPAVAQ